jgi:hypothetical protein
MEQIKKREQQLLNLGFDKNDHQRCFHKFKYNCSFTFDFHDVEEASYVQWGIKMKNYKKYLQESKTELENNELYLLGYGLAQKQIKQKITDSLNNYKSKLREETYPKLTKTINKVKVRELEIRIETLNKLL